MKECKCNRNEIGMLIKQISFQMRTHADMDLRKCDLTWSQAHLLRHLAKTEGQMSQKQIEKELEISHPPWWGWCSGWKQRVLWKALPTRRIGGLRWYS